MRQKGSKRETRGREKINDWKGRKRDEEDEIKRETKQQEGTLKKGVLGQEDPKPCKTAGIGLSLQQKNKKNKTKKNENKTTPPPPKKNTPPPKKDNNQTKQMTTPPPKKKNLFSNNVISFFYSLKPKKNSRTHYKINISANLNPPNWTKELSAHV